MDLIHYIGELPIIILINHYPDWLILIQVVMSVNSMGYIKKKQKSTFIVLFQTLYRIRNMISLYRIKSNMININ